MARLLTDIVLGFIVGAATARLCGRSVTEYAQDAARATGQAAGEIAMAFKNGYAEGRSIRKTIQAIDSDPPSSG